MKCGVFILYFLFKLTETNYAMLLIPRKKNFNKTAVGRGFSYLTAVDRDFLMRHHG